MLKRFVGRLYSTGSESNYRLSQSNNKIELQSSEISISFYMPTYPLLGRVY